MLKTLLIIFLVFAATTGFIYYQETAVCRNPLAYDIGGFDSRFGISKDKFLATAKEAETIWEKSIGRQLFNYQAGAKFKINLVFDDRQASTIEADRSKEVIEGTRAQYDAMVTDYKVMTSAYERDLAQYDKAVSAFEAKLDSYNKKIAEINSRGGATPQEFRELEEERKRLEAEKAFLDKQRIALNGRASELNSLGDTINALAKKLNINVDIHNQLFGEAREFDQGDYTGNQINIYQFEEIGDLRLVLAHEFGHALGIDHTENPKSIMYYLMDEQDIKNPALSREDKEAFTEHCEFNILKLHELFSSSQLFQHILPSLY